MTEYGTHIHTHTHTHTHQLLILRASMQGTQVPALVCQLRSHMSVDTLGLSSGGLWCVTFATLAAEPWARGGLSLAGRGHAGSP